MEAKTLKRITMYHEIHRLRHVEHLSIQRIADHLSMNFRTVKSMLDMTEEEFISYLETKGHKSFMLDPYREFIVSYIKKYEDIPSSVIHDRLKEHYSSFPKIDPKTVYNYVIRLRNELNIPLASSSERQYSPVPDVPPGEQAQVDFGEKKLRKSTGEWTKVYFFIMLLCYSRQKYVYFRTFPFDSQSSVYAHETAFEYFKGIPRTIIYDQDSVFLHQENRGDYIMTDVFGRYQTSRPFKPVFCRPADPESKGKVENTVKYVKRNFLFQRTFIDVDILNEQVLCWLNRTGNAMIHNTTRKIPMQQWAYEQPFLQTWTPLFNLSRPQGYKVLKTNVVKYRGNSYSLPFATYKNKDTRVYLKEESQRLIIQEENGNILASHQIPVGVGNNVINNNHRRDTSIKLNELRQEVKSFFLHSEDVKIFLENIDRLYPRYVRDQLTALLSAAQKSDRRDSELALAFCVKNHLISANDFRAVLEHQTVQKTRPKKGVVIKPLGDVKTQLIVNMEPEKSDIGKYEALFHSAKSINHEPVHSIN
ncbi:MAG: IS21 family transposase [Bacteroidales bacterium]|nr:IS21 family transposase [Bacteroidales bacterium]